MDFRNNLSTFLPSISFFELFQTPNDFLRFDYAHRFSDHGISQSILTATEILLRQTAEFKGKYNGK